MINILVLMLAGLFHGINEGMDMHKPNVREHRWFEFYHCLYVVEALLLIWTGYIFYIGWWILPTCILANRTFEIAYGYTRNKTMFPDYENILGFGIYVYDMYAHIWQASLWIIGIVMAIVIL
jgi:hypothetical protein